MLFYFRRIAENTIKHIQALTTASSFNSTPEIQIPKRKERGPTDILKVFKYMNVLFVYTYLITYFCILGFRRNCI